MADFEKKVTQLQNAAQEGKLVVTEVNRDPSITAAFREKAGAAAIGKDVDHIQDLRLGGADAEHNLQLLDRSVNRSVGAQQGNQLRGVPEGTKITEVKALPAKQAPTPRIRVAGAGAAPTTPPASPRARVAVEAPKANVAVEPEVVYDQNGNPIDSGSLKAMREMSRER
jgi:hypothetical protein